MPRRAECHLAGDPVAARGLDAQRERLAVHEHEPDCATPARHRHDAVPQTDARQTQSLLFGGELLALHVEFVLEAALEVGEQFIPAHEATLFGASHPPS